MSKSASGVFESDVVKFPIYCFISCIIDLICFASSFAMRLQRVQEASTQEALEEAVTPDGKE